MKAPAKWLVAFVGAIAMVIIITLVRDASRAATQKTGIHLAAQPSLTVTVTHLQPATWPLRISATGNIMAWQEASIGTETNGLRLTDLKVNVGDQVHRGQLLASFATDMVEAELAQARAAVAEARTALTEAAANAARARALRGSGALSAQQIQQVENLELTAGARLDAASAIEKTQRLRLAQTRIISPDDGVISARTAAVGAVPASGQELFRLIREGRLEWRAEVAATDLPTLRPGQHVSMTLADGSPAEGRLRALAPTIDLQSRNALVYVDITAGDAARAGMFARGHFDTGTLEVMTLPQGAVLLHEGFSYVMRVDATSHVIQTKVTTGRRLGDRVQITGGLDRDDRIVAVGTAFLSDGDLVLVVDQHRLPPPARSPPTLARLPPLLPGGAP